MRIPCTTGRSNPSILKEINPEYSLEGLILKLKLQNFGHLMQRTDSFEKTLMLGKSEGRRRRGRERMKWLDGITDSMDMSLSKSHASKVMLKILQARLQQYVNRELPDIQTCFSKGRGTRDQIANISWIIEKAREFQKNIYFCFIYYAKAFDCMAHNKL